MTGTNFTKRRFSPPLLMILLPVGATAAAFLYFFYRINPVLIYQSQQPVFFFDSLFFKEFSFYPGGVLQWLAHLLGQFYFLAAPGALLLALLFTTCCLLLHHVLKTATGRLAFAALPWLPLPFLLLLYSRYDFPLTVLAGIILSLLFALLFFKLALKNPYLQTATYLILFSILYYVAAGPALLFAVLVIIERCSIKSFVLAALFAALAIAVPWVGANTIFVLNLSDAYFANLELNVAKTPFTLTALLWGIIPIIFLLNLIKLPRKEKTSTMPQQNRTIMAGVINFDVVVFLFIIAALSPINKALKQVSYLDYYARHADWKNVLKTAEGELVNTYIGQYQVNRALFHTGKLCDSMFSYDQRAGVSGLFLHESLRSAYPLQYSDLFFELGLVNEAQHWAHEALSVTGDTPWNLQRLAEVYLLKGETAACQKCLNLLKRTFWHKKWALQFEKNLSTDSSKWPPYLQTIKSRMQTSDFIITPGEPELCLEELLASNPKNKMAYEYMLAYCMIMGKAGRLMNFADRLEELGYTAIPQNVEEVMLLFISNAGLHDHKVLSCGFRQTSVQNLNQFAAIAQKYNGDKNAALLELRKFSSTYWFYAMYYFKKQ
jgi:hypothetical protein